MAKRPAPPPGLGTSGRRVWREILAIYDFDAQELLVLSEICRTVDRLDALNAAVTELGVVDESSAQGMRANPLLVEERQQKALLVKLITALGLPLGNIEGVDKGSSSLRGLYGITAV
jgi:hypothetical protein